MKGNYRIKVYARNGLPYRFEPQKRFFKLFWTGWCNGPCSTVAIAFDNIKEAEEYIANARRYDSVSTSYYYIV